MIRFHRFSRLLLLLVTSFALMGALASAQAQAPGGDGAVECEPFLPPGWITYSVQPGDTLSSLALRTNATVAQTQYMNCVQQRARIQVGQILYLPGPGVPVLMPENFALRCHEAGIEPQTCIRIMNMLGEVQGNALLARCRNEGLAENVCQWMMTQYASEGANGLLMRCRSEGFEAEACYRLMLMIGQENSDQVMERCRGGEATVAECRWLMTQIYSYEATVPNGNGDLDRIQQRDQDRDQTCVEDCEPDRDQTRDRDRDQDCGADCEPDQDRDRIQDRDQPDSSRGQGNGRGH